VVLRAQHREPDHARGDANTIGGYAAVHDRPAAFEGADGFSYSAEILADRTDDPAAPWGGYLFFVRWARIGASSPMDHLETGYLARAATEADALAAVGAMRLSEVTATLDRLIAARDGGAPTRRWWDALRAGDDQTDGDTQGHSHDHTRDNTRDNTRGGTGR